MANKVKPLKKYGQNFLLNENYADKIVDSLEGQHDDIIIEIGPGDGILTKRLIKKKIRNIIAIEIDPRLSELLEHTYTNELTVIQKNVLDVSFSDFDFGSGVKIIGNIPYHITSKILFKIIEGGPSIKRAVLMIQREVADRLLAKPRAKAYGYLTVITQYHNKVQRILEVDREYFYPVPKVDSTVISLESKDLTSDLNDYILFRQILKTVFQQRRKMLRNSLKKLLKAKHMDIIKSINLNLRPEELSVDDYISLSNEISINGKN